MKIYAQFFRRSDNGLHPTEIIQMKSRPVTPDIPGRSLKMEANNKGKIGGYDAFQFRVGETAETSTLGKYYMSDVYNVLYT